MQKDDIAPAAPAAERRLQSRSYHGLEVVDEYAWLRAPNWREALRDPSLLPADILAHLRAEAAYADWHLDGMRDLVDVIAAEMRRNAQAPWSPPPRPFGAFAYGLRYGEGEHPLVVRTDRAGANETIILDGNEIAAGKPFFKLLAWRVSPDHRHLAYAVDVAGDEQAQIRVRDLGSGRDLPLVLERSSGSFAWTKDARALIHVTYRDDMRPGRVLRQPIHEPASAGTELFLEADSGWSASIAQSASGDFAILDLRGGQSNEQWLLRFDAPGAGFVRIAPREQGVQYYADHIGDRLIIRTNADGAEDFKLVTAPLADPARANWRDLVPHRPGVTLVSHRCLASHLVRVEREDGAPRIVLRRHADGVEERAPIDAEVFRLQLSPAFDFDTTSIGYSISTPVRPNEAHEYDFTRRTTALIKRQTLPEDFGARFELHRLRARAPDGEDVPISVVCPRDLPRDGSAPCLLYGYGAYGWSLDPGFAVERLPLLQRGFIYAIAHVRGGSERGRRWYRMGRLEGRPNVFTDFTSVAHTLIAEGFTSRGRIVAQGASAGGMLVGAAVNLDPGLFAGVIADAPFVDVLTTMLDDELPLTPGEWREWGNPILSREDFERIRSYSPYEQVRAAIYPPMLARAGIADPRVTYWEPAKWIARLRARASGGPFLLSVDFDAGHSGAEGRLAAQKARAREIAFALRCVGLGWN
ncbi:MAG: prolyl oligopeptidase family serine peptidase [Beijerinckiaceae bacterium]|nr:prolyl oligopeptidase family serine peptidase [Beijerinckiaceae bacterium]